jgi:hypothetical protein|tara:strand:+ start:813 stop:1070 length:258 start_codon:yes stop_codon:yes gene_type:complete
MKKADQIRVELKLIQAVHESGMTMDNFTDRVEYHNWLTDQLIIGNDCSNQFAYKGPSNCDFNCVHIRAVALAMDEKFSGPLAEKQ